MACYGGAMIACRTSYAMRLSKHTKRRSAGRRWRCLLGGALLGLISVQAEETRCSADNIVVHSPEPEGARGICESARDAVAFLRDAGLDTSARIEIHVVDRLPAGVEPSAAGCYVHPERRVYLLSWAGFEALRGQAVTPLQYRSLIAHEVAHAVAGCNFAVPKPTTAAQEYIAYVAMFSTMPAEARGRALEAFPGNGFDSEQQITTTLYLLAPQWFGAEAYRHYLKPGNGQAFLRKILAGEALGEENVR